MLAVINGSKGADRIERTDTLEDIARNYEYLLNCDPYQDVLIAEVNHEVIGYNRVFWEQLDDGTRTTHLSVSCSRPGDVAALGVQCCYMPSSGYERSQPSTLKTDRVSSAPGLPILKPERDTFC
jgi:hypothetical protein